MPLWSRYVPLALGLCSALLARTAAADMPYPYGYDVRVDGQTVTHAIAYHANSVLRGKDPESGVTYVLEVPEWTGLEIEGALYTFQIAPPGGSAQPFEPTRVLRLKDVHFSAPPQVGPSSVCRKRPARVVLKNNPRSLDCSLTAAERKAAKKATDEGCSDCDPCGVVYGRNYRACPVLFPKFEPSSFYGHLFLDDFKGMPFMQIDVSAARAVVQRCQQGNKAACGQVSERYKSLNPGREGSRCELEVAGHAAGESRVLDEQECLFEAYSAALTEGCRLPRCEAKYRWGGQQGQPVADTAWKPVPFPPPLDQHQRLFPSKPVHVPFKQIVQRCQQQDRNACIRVSYAYYGLHTAGMPQTSCYMEAGGKRKFSGGTVDAEECAFFAYYEAVDRGCRLPGCAVRYVWQATRTRPESEAAAQWPVEGWQVLAHPPPIDKHERLMSANPW
jgi:hypothetical protein